MSGKNAKLMRKYAQLRNAPVRGLKKWWNSLTRQARENARINILRGYAGSKLIAKAGA